ncbi:MAG: hypothetical protein H7Y43_16090 [Akkermansiaceae bacterium]|nr:hypothetical protein [Verrucomicrobiales bacterium]
MNARWLNFILGGFVICLLLLNGVTLLFLLRQRSEMESLRAQLAAAESKEEALPVTKRVLTPQEMAAASMAATQTLSIVLGEVNQENGLRQVYDTLDGKTLATQIDGVPCRELVAQAARQKIYFQVPPAFKQNVPMNARVQVEYYDAAPEGSLYVEFTGAESYTPSEQSVPLKNAAAWQTVEFDLKDAQFNGKQKGADFRVTATKRQVFVRRVTLKRT